jgi:competence protein ComEA
VDPGRIGKLQVAVYAGLGIVLVLLGLKALSAPPEASEGGDGGGVSLTAEPVGSGDPGASSGDVVVHVAGAVREPGVYRLAAGARVADAIERAGGAEPSGDEDAINLAAMLADGQQVVVPAKLPAGAAAGAAAGATAEEGPISLGTATAEDLETIDGIGPITAADIISYRDGNGGVGSIEQLDEIPGIGPATIESLSERLQP